MSPEENKARLTVLIAEDESLSRAKLRSFLEAEPGVLLIVETATGPDTLSAIRQCQPHILFLDILLPGINGFQVLAALEQQRPMPAIVIVTANKDFALQAFEVAAADFLLKPFDRDRFKLALQRARARLEHSDPVPDRIVVKDKGTFSLFKADELDWARAADNYIELHFGKRILFSRSSMSKFADSLSPKFVQLNRSTVVNIDRIREMRSKSHGDYQIILRDGTELTASRNFKASWAALLSRGVP